MEYLGYDVELERSYSGHGTAHRIHNSFTNLSIQKSLFLNYFFYELDYFMRSSFQIQISAKNDLYFYKRIPAKSVINLKLFIEFILNLMRFKRNHKKTLELLIDYEEKIQKILM